MPATPHIDHKNGDGLDCRRQNLRAATVAQNIQNRGVDRRNRSGVRGVLWRADEGLWHASITCNGKTEQLGRFERLEDATVARRRAEVRLFNEFAFTPGGLDHALTGEREP